MKLLMCLKCGDIFSLSRKEKTCGCGETKGLYVDELNAEISGECQPIGIANGSFSQSIKVQRPFDTERKVWQGGIAYYDRALCRPILKLSKDKMMNNLQMPISIPSAGADADSDMQPIVIPSADIAVSPMLVAALSEVAVFMGMERTEKETGEPTFKQEKNAVIWASQLMYNRSWDWFMPAYKYFSSLQGMPMPTYMVHYRNISAWVERVNIEEAFKTLVQAIRWYNDVVKGLS